MSGIKHFELIHRDKLLFSKKKTLLHKKPWMERNSKLFLFLQLIIYLLYLLPN